MPPLVSVNLHMYTHTQTSTYHCTDKICYARHLWLRVYHPCPHNIWENSQKKKFVKMTRCTRWNKPISKDVPSVRARSANRMLVSRSGVPLQLPLSYDPLQSVQAGKHIERTVNKHSAASVCWQRWGLCNSEKCTSTHTPYSQVDCSPALAANIHEPYSVCVTSNRAGCGLTCKYQIHICGANVCHH